MKTSFEKLKRSNQVDGYQYHFKHEDGSKGDAQIIFTIIGDGLGKLQEAFLQYGLEKGDKYVHLNEFYPNGKGLNENVGENMKKGIGTKVLELLILKARIEGAKGMYVFTSKISMENFLAKHGFIKIGNYQYFKLLKELN